jgi:hypothetical protein
MTGYQTNIEITPLCRALVYHFGRLLIVVSEHGKFLDIGLLFPQESSKTKIHGTSAMYKRCRCLTCVEVNSAYHKRKRESKS